LAEVLRKLKGYLGKPWFLGTLPSAECAQKPRDLSRAEQQNILDTMRALTAALTVFAVFAAPPFPTFTVLSAFTAFIVLAARALSLPAFIRRRRSSKFGDMLICIENLIDEATLALLRGWMAEATFEDGRATAGGNAAVVKNNEQVSSDPERPDPKLEEMKHLVRDALWDNNLFCAAAEPKRIHPPLFSRYSPGMGYGTHMDNALMGNSRVDMSLTLFLSDPASYDGGELVIELPFGERAVKLPAGSAVLYSTTALHRVAAVTRGERLAAVTWVRSYIRDPAKREILFDLRTAHYRLADQLGKTPEVDMLSKTHTNLLRRWAED